MANNGGRQGGGGGGNQQMNEHVEFTVKAEEDLYLKGTEKTLLRVSADTNYSCLMLKTQRFSSLFRHYAKYHGLRKDDLEYYFVNPLENEDTPETVHLQRSDTIMVRKKRRPTAAEAESDDSEFFKDMRELLDDEEHMDVVFMVHASPIVNTPLDGGSSRLKSDPGVDGPVSSSSSSSSSNINKVTGTKRELGDDASNSFSSSLFANLKTPVKKEEPDTTTSMMVDPDSSFETSLDKSKFIEIRAHRCILTARGEYFKARFRKISSYSGKADRGNTAFGDCSNNRIQVDPNFSAKTIRLMLEFIYSNRISNLNSETTDSLLSLLHLSDQWLLHDLKRLVELELISSHLDVNSVARIYCTASDYYNAKRLVKACIVFIRDNIREVSGNRAFSEEIKNHPQLCIPVLQATVELIPDQHQPVTKKQRTSDHGGHSGSTPSSTTAVSSPVPDSDA